MRRTRKLRGDAGTQVVEFALILPLLAFIVMVICEGAEMIRTHQVINNAAREGARLSAQSENRNASGPAAIQQAVINYAANNKVAITTSQVQVDQNKMILQPSGIAISASRVVVTINYQLHILPKLPGSSAPNVVPLGGSAEFRNFP
jgi:Flp pilus assembly protein TadG